VRKKVRKTLLLTIATAVYLTLASIFSIKKVCQHAASNQFIDTDATIRKSWKYFFWTLEPVSIIREEEARKCLRQGVTT
jgi:hypothetical protein